MSLNVGELTARIGVDGLQTFRSDLQRAGSDFRDFSREVDRTADQSRQAIDRLGQRVSQAGRDAGNELGDGLGRGAEQGRRDVEQQMDRVRQELQRTGREAEQSGSDAGAGFGAAFSGSLEGALDGTTERLQGMGENMGNGLVSGFMGVVGRAGSAGPIGAAIAAGLAVQVGIPLMAGAKIADLVIEGFEARAAQGFIKAQFGWTPQQAEQAGKAASDAYINAFGESVNANREAAGVAIQAGLLDGDATAAEMQPVIEQLQIVSSLMGEEIPEVARAAGQMVKTGMADNITEAFDLLTVGQQKGLNLSGDLIDTVVEYGVQYQKLGVDGATALGTIAQMSKAGARDTDLAADALKEFSIRAMDGSEASMQAFADLNLNAEETAAAFAKGGDSALGMSRVVLTALAKIEDPMKRNEIGVALLGTQWEDLGPAIAGLDLDRATAEMDGFGGATKRAGDDMSGAASGIEGAKRTIEVAVDGMKASLSDAFAPLATDLAAWVTDNKEEIITFLQDVAKYLGVASGATIYFAGQFITGMGYVVDAMTDGGALIIDSFGNIAEVMGNILKHIPGMQGIGEDLIEAGKRADGMAEKMYGAGESMKTFGQKVADAGYKVAELATQIGEIPPGKEIKVDTPGGQGVLDLLKSMNAAVTTDNNKNIVVEAPLAPEVLEQLKAIGIEAKIVDNKTVLVAADKTQYNEAMREVVSPVTKKVNVVLEGSGANLVYPKDSNFNPGNFPVPQGQPRATGGPVYGPGTKTSDDVLIAASTGEFVQQAAAVDYYGLNFMHAVNQRRIPKELIPHLATGGSVLDSLVAIQQRVAPSLQLTSGQRDEPGSFHGIGQAGDFSNGTSNTPEMLAFARYMAQNYGAALAELIYHDPNFSGQQIDEGRIVPDSFFAGAGDHTNHVHVAAHQPLPLPTGGGVAAPVQDITLTPQSSRDDVARKIIAEGRKRGYTDEEIVAVLAHARGESNLDPTAIGGGGAWHGVFQQDSSYPGRDDPNQNIAEFYNRLDEKRSSPGASGDIWKNIFWLQQRPGEPSADAAYANGRQEYLTSEMRPHEGEARDLLNRLGPTVGGVGPQSGYVQVGPGTDPYGTTYTDNGYTGNGSGTSRGAPPEDPSTVTLTFQNPLKPWWWTGEEKYRQRIIDDYEKQKAWDEYWSGGGNTNEKTEQGKKVTVKSIEEATKDLEDAKFDLELALQRQKEMKPDAPESSKMSMQKSVDDAREKVREAEEELARARANPSGYYYEQPTQNNGAPAGLPGPAKPMATGGTIPGVGNTDSELILGMPGEEIIRKDVAEQPGMRRFLKAINAGLVPAPPGFAAGGTVGAGFGGYVHDDSDVMAPKNWRDWLGLATGSAFALYNLFEPYVNAAVTGKVDLGNITPRLNTGSTDTGLVTSTLSAAASQLSQQIDELIWAVKEGKNITVKIEGARDPFNGPQIAMRTV